MKRMKSTFFLFLAIFVLLVGCESHTVSHSDPNVPGPQGAQQPEKDAQGAAPQPALQAPSPDPRQGQDSKTNSNASGSVNLTDNEVKDILNQLIPKAVGIYGIFNGTGWFKIDKTKTIPGENEYCLVTGETWKSNIDTNDVKSIADLKNVVEAVFTKDITEKVFYSRYLTSVKGVSPLYKDYEGMLYEDSQHGGHGWSTKFLIDTAKLKEQNDNMAEIEMDTKVLDDPGDKITIKIEYVNDKWLLASRLD